MGSFKLLEGMYFLYVGSCIARPGSVRPHATTVKESMGAGLDNVPGLDNFLPRAATEVALGSLRVSAAPAETPKNGSPGSFYTPKG